MGQFVEWVKKCLCNTINYYFPRPICVVCAAHNVSADAEADMFSVKTISDIVLDPAPPAGLPWIEYSPPILKKHGLVLGYEFNFGDGSYLWSFYDPACLEEYSAAFDADAPDTFDMYVKMIIAGKGVLFLGSDQRLVDYGLDE